MLTFANGTQEENRYLKNKTRVVYFALHGRCEMIRAMLHYSDIDFLNEEISPPPSEEWPNMKKSGRMVFNSLPEITYEGVVMNQSKAAARAIAIKLGYYRESPEECYAIDSIMEFNQENNDQIFAYAFSDRSEQGNLDWVNAWKKLCDILEARLEEHKRPYIAGTNGITLADFSLIGTFFGQIYNEKSIWKGELSTAVTNLVLERPFLRVYVTETL